MAVELLLASISLTMSSKKEDAKAATTDRT